MFEEVEDAGNCFKAVLMIAKVVMVVHNIALGTHTLHFLSQEAFGGFEDFLSSFDGCLSELTLLNCLCEALIIG